MTAILSHDWMAALISATDELATTSLGFDEGTVVSTSSNFPEIAPDDYVSLIGIKEPLSIGLVTTREDSFALARALFAMTPEEDDPSEEDLTDALGEITNVLAGGVKSRILDESMIIGVPTVLSGTEASGVCENRSVSISAMRWNDVEGKVFLMA